MEAENAFILSGYGLRYRNSNETYRQFLLLGALTGRLGKPGSGVFEALQLQSWPPGLQSTSSYSPEVRLLMRSKKLCSSKNGCRASRLTERAKPSGSTSWTS